MSQTELLRTQLDTVRREVQRLEVENARLRDNRPETAAAVDARKEADRFRVKAEHLATEVEELRDQLHEAQENEAKATREAEAATKALQDQLNEPARQRAEEECSRQAGELENLRKKSATTISQLTERCREAENECKRLKMEVGSSATTAAQLTERCREAENESKRLKMEMESTELRPYRKLDAERTKWEEREERLLERLEDVRQLIDAADDRRREMPVHNARRQVNFSAKSLPEAVTETRSSPDHTQMKLDCPDGTSTSGDHNMSEPLSSTFPSAPVTWSAALLAHQLPPLRSFTGEDIDNGETFQDWIEQFEMVASIGGWDERAKLVNLTTRLRGQAYTFYKSCPDQERRKYTTLVAQLKQRFTPVRLRAVQSSLFHDRKQKFP